MERLNQYAVRLLSLSLLAFAFFLLLADGGQHLLTFQWVSILSKPVMDGFRALVEYKKVSILGLAVLLSAMTILRSPTVPHK